MSFKPTKYDFAAAYLGTTVLFWGGMKTWTTAVVENGYNLRPACEIPVHLVDGKKDMMSGRGRVMTPPSHHNHTATEREETGIAKCTLLQSDPLATATGKYPNTLIILQLAGQHDKAVSVL